ncbi:HigA2-like helix-turn-helix domain-containing protein [Vibrio crassostreae]|nr:HigA2-like helix-turn-helix domain-containing protein [Vibrio crassostreae]
MNQKEIKKEALKVFRKELKKSNLTQEQSSKIFGTHQSRISTLSSGNNENLDSRLSTISLDKICEYLSEIGYTFKISKPKMDERKEWNKKVESVKKTKRA